MLKYLVKSYNETGYEDYSQDLRFFETEEEAKNEIEKRVDQEKTIYGHTQTVHCVIPIETQNIKIFMDKEMNTNTIDIETYMVDSAERIDTHIIAKEDAAALLYAYNDKNTNTYIQTDGEYTILVVENQDLLEENIFGETLSH